MPPLPPLLLLLPPPPSAADFDEEDEGFGLLNVSREFSRDGLLGLLGDLDRRGDLERESATGRRVGPLPPLLPLPFTGGLRLPGAGDLEREEALEEPFALVVGRAPLRAGCLFPRVGAGGRGACLISGGEVDDEVDDEVDEVDDDDDDDDRAPPGSCCLRSWSVASTCCIDDSSASAGPRERHAARTIALWRTAPPPLFLVDEAGTVVVVAVFTVGRGLCSTAAEGVLLELLLSRTVTKGAFGGARIDRFNVNSLRCSAHWACTEAWTW